MSLDSSSSYCPSPSTSTCPVLGLGQGQLDRQLSVAQTYSWNTFSVGIHRRRTSGISRKPSQALAAEGGSFLAGIAVWLGDAKVPGSPEA